MRTDCQAVKGGECVCGQWEGRAGPHQPIRGRAYLTAGLAIDSPAGCEILLANFPTQLKCKIYVIKNIYSHEFTSDHCCPIKLANQRAVWDRLDQWEASNAPDLVSPHLAEQSMETNESNISGLSITVPPLQPGSVKSSQFQILNIFQDTEKVILLIQSDNRDKKYEKWTHIQINGFLFDR